MDRKKVITISRQFGSGGYEIGKKLAQALDISFYDKDIIRLAAEKSGMSKEVFERLDETVPSPLGQTFAMGSSFALFSETPLNDQVFFAESDVIRSLADKESCVIVGRCADYVLREYRDVYNVYVFAAYDFRMERIKKDFKMDDKAAKNAIHTIDKRRASYYNFYTEKSWGAASSYHLSVDSGFTGIDKTVEIIRQYVLL